MLSEILPLGKFHSTMSYGIIFWGNSPHSLGIFKMQKRFLWTLMGIGYRDSCRELFKEERILSRPSQYIFSLLLFVTRNLSLFVPNSVYVTLTPGRKTICNYHMHT